MSNMASPDVDYHPPGKKRKQDKPHIPTTEVKCIICDGSHGPLTECDLQRQISKRGLQTLTKVCLEYKDQVNDRLRDLSVEDRANIKFHESCRVAYTHKSREYSGQTRQENSKCETAPLLRSQVCPFCWQEECVICGDIASVRNPLSIATRDPYQFYCKLKTTALERIDAEAILHRLASGDSNREWRYHRKCYQTFTSSRNIASHGVTQKNSKDNPSQQGISLLVKQLEQTLFVDGKILYLSEACSKYKRLVQSHYASESTHDFKVKPSWLKNKLVESFGNRIQFYSRRGKPDVFCSEDISIGALMKHLQNEIGELNIIEKDREFDVSCDAHDSSNDNVQDKHNSSEDIRCLHQAAAILGKQIQAMEETNAYHTVQQVGQEASEAFVPSKLLCFLQMVVDQKAFQSANETYKSNPKIRRRCTAISECIVYTSRRGRHQVIPPLHLGLLLQMHHQYGSYDLIDTLNCHGFCASYDELRLFLSAAAEKELQCHDSEFLPSEVISREKGGSIIQEGNDNIDINVQTIDGKDTYHAMARVVFQRQVISKDRQPCTPISRPKDACLQNRALCVDSKKKHALTKPQRFQKPTSRPTPPRHKDPLDLIHKLAHCPILLPRDLAWDLLRGTSRRGLCNPEPMFNDQSIPMWTGFNHSLEKRDELPSYTLASYAPTIEAPPADMATVYSTLKRGQALTSKACQPFQIHTFDQQLYAVAQQVKWAMPEEFGSLINRLGGFHGMCSFISCIGKIWGDGGLKDMLVDSNVYAQSTVDQMLSGRQFHRAVRGLTLCYEALLDRFTNAFVKWCFSSCTDHNQIIQRLEKLLIDVYGSLSSANCKAWSEDATKELEEFLEGSVLPVMMDFVEEMNKVSPTFTYWFMCLKALQIMLLNIRAERTGNWQLHLQCMIGMMPYFFSCNHQNYSRWTTSYLIDMLTILPTEVDEAFKEGLFVVRRSPGKFNGIWSDMGVECTVIRDSKERNTGIIGKTHTETTALRWCLTNLLLGQYCTAMTMRKHGLEHLEETPVHEQTKPARMKQDEEHVCLIIQHISENMTDPYNVENHPDALVNIGSGLHATDEVQKSLLTAVERGSKAFENFAVTRFSDTHDKSYWDAIPKSGLKTFTDMRKTTPIYIAGKRQNVTMSAETAFRRALAISDSRDDANLATLLSRPITSVPTMLFKEDGTMKKTQKSEILHWIEDKVPAVRTRPPESTELVSVYIVDGMAEVQALSGDTYRTFNDLGQGFLDKLVSNFKYSNEVHIIFDRYDNPDSIKAEERLRRTGGSMGKTYDVIGGRVVPKWKKFLDVITNKAALTYFLSDYLTENVILACDNLAFHISGGFTDIEKSIRVDSVGNHCDVKELSSDQEEADTRIFLHLVDFNNRCAQRGVNGRAFIKSPDTDVTVLAVYFFPQLTNVVELWIEIGTSTRTVDHHRFLPIHQVCYSLGSEICKVLPAAHALTGCDNISSFHGIGKKSVMKALSVEEGKRHTDLLALGGTSLEDAVNASRKLTLDLYCAGKKKNWEVADLNSLRVRLAKGKSCASLPPSEASFLFHVKRAAWQTRIWMSSGESGLLAGQNSPIGNGWKRGDRGIMPVFFEGPTACEMLDQLVCNCKGRSKCLNKCPCKTNDLPCTELCSCESDERCSNPISKGQEAEEHNDP